MLKTLQESKKPRMLEAFLIKLNFRDQLEMYWVIAFMALSAILALLTVT